MIDVRLIGETRFGGEVYALVSDTQYEIPAVRIFVSMGKPIRDLVGRDVRDTLGFIGLVNSGAVDAKAYVRRILSYLHGDVGEFGSVAVYLRGVSRLTTFLSWIPVGALRGVQGVGTERSLRYVTHRSGFVFSDKIFDESYDAYLSLKEGGLHREDARYVLPLAVKTEVIMQIPAGRELGKWASHMASQPFGEARDVGEAVDRWNREEHGFEMPRVGRFSQRFPMRISEEHPRRRELGKIVGARGVLYDPATETLIMRRVASIASMHQDVRNRRVIFYWPSWERVVHDDTFVFPETGDEEIYGLLSGVSRRLLSRARELWGGWSERSVYYLPMAKAMEVYSIIHGNNSIYGTIRLRTCMRAQWEIRRHYWLVVREIRGLFPGRLGPMCITNMVCYEPGKEDCPLYKGLQLRLRGRRPPKP